MKEELAFERENWKRPWNPTLKGIKEGLELPQFSNSLGIISKVQGNRFPPKKNGQNGNQGSPNPIKVNKVGNKIKGWKKRKEVSVKRG